MGGSEPESEFFVTSSNDGDSVRAFLDREVEASSEAFLFPSTISQSCMAQKLGRDILSYINAMSRMVAPTLRYVAHNRKQSRLAIVVSKHKTREAERREIS